MISKQHKCYRKNNVGRFSNMKMNLANLRHEPNQKKKLLFTTAKNKGNIQHAYKWLLFLFMCQMMWTLLSFTIKPKQVLFSLDSWWMRFEFDTQLASVLF